MQERIPSTSSEKTHHSPTSASSSSTKLDMPPDLEARPSKTYNNVTATTTDYPTNIPYWKFMFDQAPITQDILYHNYAGSGTEADPYLVKWIPNDPRNPMQFGFARKWIITMTVAMATLAVSFVSSAYSGATRELEAQFKCGPEVLTLGISLFVLGFAVGPLVWAPVSEIYGRQYPFWVSYFAFTAFNGGAIGAKNIETVLIMRFFAGTFGSSPLTNAGGVIADMFPASHRGLATAIFAAAPFMGPVIGPVAGGFLGENAGWRWVMAMMTIFTGVMLIFMVILTPETYAPILLRKRAVKLSQITGQHYRSHIDAQNGPPPKLARAFKTALSRPWILLFTEPIVAIIAIYMAIIYGTLYMCFGAFPIVFQLGRGWSEGIGGLAFLGVMVGMLIAVAWSIFIENPRYLKVSEENNGFAPPESRLVTALIGSICIPVALFWFAWTNSPSVHWIVPIIAMAPFGFGMLMVFLSCMNYLIDSYTIYAASVLAANSVLRSLCGAAFPLFTRQMYANLGIHWASSVPAFLALACVPFPFLFYKYGAPIRAKCKYSAISDKFMRKMAAQVDEGNNEKKAVSPSTSTDDNGQSAIGDDGEKVNYAPESAGAPIPSHEEDLSATRTISQPPRLTVSHPYMSRTSSAGRSSKYDDNVYESDGEPVTMANAKTVTMSRGHARVDSVASSRPSTSDSLKRAHSGVSLGRELDGMSNIERVRSGTEMRM